MRTKKKPFGAVLLLIASTIFCSSSTAITADKIKFQLDWIIEGKYVPFFVARDKGFFIKNGLGVTLIEGKGSGNSATFVDAGQADYSYGDLLPTLHAMSKGGENRGIGVGLGFRGVGLIGLESSGIKEAKELEG